MRRSIGNTVALFEKRIRMIRKPAYGNTFCRKTAFLVLPLIMRSSPKEEHLHYLLLLPDLRY